MKVAVSGGNVNDNACCDDDLKNNEDPFTLQRIILAKTPVFKIHVSYWP